MPAHAFSRQGRLRQYAAWLKSNFVRLRACVAMHAFLTTIKVRCSWRGGLKSRRKTEIL
jgi:hypothetical protein